tara:strand:+ start:284 stop:430 length:147 start_codon:yes stop_codon:yes gene_type:complete
MRLILILFTFIILSCSVNSTKKITDSTKDNKAKITISGSSSAGISINN